MITSLYFSLTALVSINNEGAVTQKLVEVLLILIMELLKINLNNINWFLNFSAKHVIEKCYAAFLDHLNIAIIQFVLVKKTS